jgi:hypothetical protein
MEITLTLTIDEINYLIDLYKSANAIIELKEKEIRNAGSGNVVRINDWLKVYEQLESDIYDSSTTIENLQNIKKEANEN